MTLLDNYLSDGIRQRLEDRYYAQINVQSRFEVLQSDPDFLNSLDRHVALYSDHGVVHVRDVAEQLLGVVAQGHGVLFAKRPLIRLERMKGYGVVVAYLHDIGMVNFSDFGRAMHPEFASQAVYDPVMEEFVQAIWAQNSGNIAWHLLNLSSQGILQQSPMIVLRELLALSMCHSKSKVPIAVLNEPERLRELMISAISTDLTYLFHQQRVQKAQLRLAKRPLADAEVAVWETAVSQATAACDHYRQTAANLHNPHLASHYHNPTQEAFRWLISPHPQLQEWVADVVDTLRALRCADALRQRGGVLKTSGSYEVFVNQHTGNAVCALRQGDKKLFLFELPDPISAGEANIASSELDPAGDLRISFAQGVFSTAEATQNAVYCAAVVVNDIQSDVIGSFQRPHAPEATSGLKSANAMRILLEETDDNLHFANQVKQQLTLDYPEMVAQVQIVPSLQLASPLERELYRTADTIGWDSSKRRELLDRIGQSGHYVVEIDPQRAFEHVRLATVAAGQVLIEANTPAAFVYIPLGPGLEVVPLGGYQSFRVEAWMPLGVTGVIRGATRNASVIATRTVRLLMIPKTVYLTHWHHMHSMTSFRQLLGENQRQVGQASGQLTQAEKVALLKSVPLFAALANELLLALAAVVEEVMVAAGEPLWVASSMGNSLTIVAEGQVQVAQNGRLSTLAKGAFWGELALLAPEPQLASVTAVLPTRLLRLHHDTFNQFVEAHSKIAREMLAILAQRLHAMTLAASCAEEDKSAG